ncbi:ABC transporter substrate-binding protein [Actinobacteria bacterium YIM 96077]|uniref:Solute-binding protein family 5 domain-containing protein n=1 Tax=Phytoactinopolyspora halophila TaxID=1981511 RepID=A0A329R409_9ACTN|nr:ABC transporter substrate-binding protein [Actinobacteria bacterium YIM 96077]RAW18799.1 hypothetical protein DPM12_01670 [Phytoactinopolyspora halophila]
MWSNPISRRKLLQATGAGALVLGGGAGAGCTSDAPSDSPDETANGNDTGRDGSLSASLANIFRDLDPTTASAVGTVAVNNYIYESLYRLDPFPPRTELTPELATEMPREIDPLTHRIKLRDDAVFHDGSPLTAEDVAFTIERIKDPDVESLFARFFEIVDAVDVVDEHEIELNLTAPTTLLAQRLVLVKGMSQAAIEDSPDALELEPVGTGPYRVLSAVSGQEITLERFDEYTGPRELNYDELHIAVTADGSARVSALRTGRAQVIEDVPASSFDELESEDDVEVDSARGDHLTGLMFHCGKPPFDDVRVRQAVMYGIDRDGIAETAFFGHAEPVWSGEISPDDPDYAEPDLTYRYDPDYARQLLDEAGFGDGGIDVDFLAGDLDYLAAQTPLIEENLRELGFVPNVIPGELESLYSRVTEGSYNLFLMKGDTSALGATDVEFLLRWTYYGNLPRQFMYWEGEPLERVEELLDEALTAPDDDARSSALAEVQNIVQTEVPIGRLHRVDYLTGWSASLDGFRPVPTAGFVLDGVTG